MDERALGIVLSRDVARLLQENEVDLYSEIAKRVVDVSLPMDDMTLPSSDRGVRSVELLILTSAIAAPLVATAIKQIIGALAHKNVRVSEDGAVVPRKDRISLKFSFLGLKVEFEDEETR